MTLPISSSPTAQAFLSNRLKKMTASELEKIQKKLNAIVNPEAFVQQIIEWKARFLKCLETNDDHHPIILKMAQEIELLLMDNPLLKMPIRNIDERHALLETLIQFVSLHIELPNPLLTAATRIKRLQLAKPLTEERKNEIERIRARKAAEAETLANLQPVRPSKVHTFADLTRKVEQEAAAKLQQIEQLEQQQLRDVDLRELIEAIQAHEKGNRDLKQGLRQVHRALPVLDRLLNPFRPVEEGEVAVIETHPEILKSALRRRLRAELWLLNQEIRSWKKEDTMTKAIQIWVGDFWEALTKPAPEEAILKGYIEVAQEILIEPIYKTPLDEEAFFGSDGHTYGKKAHALWQKKIPQFRYKTRSPFDLQNSAKLKLEPHPVARYMTGWLKSHGALLVSKEIAKELAEMPRTQQKEIQENKRIMREHVASFEEASRKEDQKRLEEHAKHLKYNRDMLIGLISHEIAPVELKVEEYEFQTGEIMEDHTKEIEQLYEDIQKLNQRNIASAVDIAQNRSVYSEMEIAGKQLEIDINDTRKAIKKMHKNSLKGTLKTVAGVAIAVAASYAAYECGVPVAVTPIVL